MKKTFRRLGAEGVSPNVFIMITVSMQASQDKLYWTSVKCDFMIELRDKGSETQSSYNSSTCHQVQM